MSWENAKYSNIRKEMNPGDVIAFGGKGNFSQIIKWATRSSVSHVGVILQSNLLIDNKPQDGFFNQIIESTSLNGFSGVTISRLSDRIDTYDGEIWWLPLSDQARQELNFQTYYNFLLHQNRKEYDMPQAVKSALDAFDEIAIIEKATHNLEDFSRFFCSELVSAGLEAGGVIKSLNSSEVTPIDLCKFNIYQEKYFQLKGGRKEIKSFNNLSPEGWGV
jgi:hypothetical protein